MTKDQALKEGVQRLLRQAASVGVRPRWLRWDRGSSRVVVVRYLQAVRRPFLMPVVGHGRSPKPRGGPTGRSVFRTGKTSGWSADTRTDATKRTATMSIGGTCRNGRGERKRPGRPARISADWGDRPSSPDSVLATSGLRFGIESSYRPMQEGRTRTPPRRPAVRRRYVGIALVRRTRWMWRHDTIHSMTRRGGRVVLLERLRWETLLCGLLHVVEEAFGTADVTDTERDIEYELAM